MIVLFTLMLPWPPACADVLEVLNPAVTKIVSPRATLDVVIENQTWTEGPLAWPDGRLLFADIKTNSIRAVDARGRVEILRRPSGDLGPAPYPGPESGSSGMAVDDRGRVVTAGHAGRAILRFDPSPAGRREVLVERFEGRRLNSPNDVIVARDRSIYFTDPPFGLPTQKPGDPRQEIDFAGVYRLRNPGESTQALDLISRDLRGPNGLALSPDEKTLYVADTPSKTWVKFEKDRAGKWRGPRPFAAVGDDARPGEPDGLKVDREGHVFAAGPGGVWIFDATGRHLGTLRVPRRTTNVGFGGPRRKTLFITAGVAIYKIELR